MRYGDGLTAVVKGMKDSWGEQTADVMMPQMIGGTVVVTKEGVDPDAGGIDRDEALEKAAVKPTPSGTGGSDGLHGIAWTPADAAKSAGLYVAGMACLFFAMYTLYSFFFCLLLDWTMYNEQNDLSTGETREGGLATSFAGLPPVSAYCTGGP